MMPNTGFAKSSTPISTVSSLATTNTATAVQSGPYTKAQFHNTMDGSRSVKNAKEIEQLLRDYPAALELYRTGRYKVKLKNEADIERVILVEKRTNKNIPNNITISNEQQQNNQSNLDISTAIDKNKNEQNTEQSHNRTHSKDRVAPSTSTTDNNTLVQTTTSSMHTLNHSQPKVDNHRISSKERDLSLTSHSKKQQQQQQTPNRSQSRDDSRSKISHSKHKERKSHRDHPRAVVPYVPNVQPSRNMWHQSRALQPYYSQPVLPHQSPGSNMYMSSPYGSHQNPAYQQPYYYGQSHFPAIGYQKPSGYPSSSKVKSAGNITNQTLYSSHNYPLSPSKGGYNTNYGSNLPLSYHTCHPNQQQCPPPNVMYQSQMPYQSSAPWPSMTNRPTGHGMNNYADSRQSSKHRARSVETGSRRHAPAHHPNQQQPASGVTEQHHHRHHHHHHRSHPTNAPNTTTTTSQYVEVGKDANVLQKEAMATATAAAANTSAPAEKLTIRQLNEIFLQMDPAGRLPYNSLPNILQRFGIVLSENDLTSAAQSLGYNTVELLSARRLVHILVKLGKIAKSAQQQQRTTASPTILPEDREVNDIMTQRRAAGAASTHIHSSVYPNHWY